MIAIFDKFTIRFNLYFINSSGEEGIYPDLTKHAETRLADVKPTSIILRKSEPVIMRNMLDPSECNKIDKDINDWTHEMLSREKDLEEGKALITEPLFQPDIRQFKEESVKVSSIMSYNFYFLPISMQK